jgi:hypothetical protein
MFNFDRDLFITKVYERALRSSLKERLRQQQADFESSKMSVLSPLKKLEMEEQERRSKVIDHQLKDSKWFMPRANVLLVGTDHDGQELLMEQMKTMRQSGYTMDELRVHGLSVKQTLIAAMSAVAEYVQEKHPEQLEKDDMNDVRILAQELEKIQPEEDGIPQPAVSAMARLWKSQSFLEYLTGHLSTEIYLHDSTL